MAEYRRRRTFQQLRDDEERPSTAVPSTGSTAPLAGHSAGHPTALSRAALVRAARDAARGTWAEAGFHAVTAVQTARAAKAHEEQLALQRVIAEQQGESQFARWRQTPDGQAFLTWRTRAMALVQFIRDRDAAWVQAWARVIGKALAQISDEEKERFLAYPAKLRQAGLRIVATTVTVVACLIMLRIAPALITTLVGLIGELAKPEALTALPSGPRSAGGARVVAGIGVALILIVIATPITAVAVTWRLYAKRRRAAAADPTVPLEAQARINR